MAELKIFAAFFAVIAVGLVGAAVLIVVLAPVAWAFCHFLVWYIGLFA